MGEGISIVPLVEARWCFLLLSIWFSFWLSSRLVVALPVTGPRLILRHRVEVHFHPQSVQGETHFVNLILKVRWANQEASKNCGLDNSLIIASYTRSMNSDRIGCLKTCENWIESADLYRVWVFERYMKDLDISTMLYRVCLLDHWWCTLWKMMIIQLWVWLLAWWLLSRGTRTPGGTSSQGEKQLRINRAGCFE